MMGAQPLINQPERTLEEALTDTPATRLGDIRQDPWPEVSVGITTAAASGALTGGIAAGSWSGAGIGAGLNTTAWSLFTLLNSWRVTGPRARGVLVGATVVGALITGTSLYLRRRRR